MQDLDKPGLDLLSGRPALDEPFARAQAQAADRVRRHAVGLQRQLETDEPARGRDFRIGRAEQPKHRHLRGREHAHGGAGAGSPEARKAVTHDRVIH